MMGERSSYFVQNAYKALVVLIVLYDQYNQAIVILRAYVLD